MANPHVFALHVSGCYCGQILLIDGKPFRSFTPVFIKLGTATGCHGVRETRISNGGRVSLAVLSLRH